MKSTEDRVGRIQQLLRRSAIQGWLFYDFRGLDPLASRILGLSPDTHTTRRWFYFVPAEGTPAKLVHRIESGTLDSLPGEKSVYLRWSELQEGLRAMLRRCAAVAMQYSENNAIPYVSRVDAGTVELVRSIGVEVVSSADLLQQFESVLTAAQLAQHRRAAGALTEIVQQAFRRVARDIESKGNSNEYDTQQFILSRFEQEGLTTDAPPVVAVNANSSDPHYEPGSDRNSDIVAGDWLLIDLWARPNEEDSVFADITWTASLNKSVPARIEQIFNLVRRARDRGVEFLQNRYRQGESVRGYEVDDAVRAVIEKADYGDYFVHRTGHNMAREVHGNGAHFDNLESHDTREVIPGLLCTIEPGIYLPEFGVRSEIDVYIGEQGPEVTTAAQTSPWLPDF